VKRSAEQAVRQGHPWLYQRSIRRQSHQGSAGDLAIIFDRGNRFLAVGLYDPDSVIRVRILHHGKPKEVNGQFFAERISAAVAKRDSIDQRSTSAYRLVHGENDGLPGVVLDKYDHTLVLKLYSMAWVPWLEVLGAAIGSSLDADRLVLRMSRSASRDFAGRGEPGDGSLIWGDPFDGKVRFLENGLRFETDVYRGQKTGFFLDQRDNRARAERYAKGKSVLNMFSYTGAFSLYVARGGATQVTGVDASLPALQAYERNFELNRDHTAIGNVERNTIRGDVFEVFAQLAAAGNSYDMVIVDPPSFASRRSQVHQALSAYRRLAALAVGVLRPSGTLILASCTGRVEADSFFAKCHQGAGEGGRILEEIKRTFHAADHPIGFAEGAYLKCLFAICP
jgi:23S rRNA (cytosine1962-C5)-methyltransferase